jgi:hypothetical protein
VPELGEGARLDGAGWSERHTAVGAAALPVGVRRELGFGGGGAARAVPGGGLPQGGRLSGVTAFGVNLAEGRHKVALGLAGGPRGFPPALLL